MEEDNRQLVFKEILDFNLENFGQGSQDGVKAVLRQCQEEFKCVSLANQKQIAEKFNLDEKIVKTLIKLSPGIKESIVETEVVCCSGARCSKNGSFEVLKTVSETLGIGFDEITEDGRIRLTSQNCFKRCGEGPNIMVNGKFYHKMNKEKARDLMKEIKS